MTDIVLGREIRKGKEQAFAQFFRKYHPTLLAYMIVRTGHKELAEEITQEAFVILWEKRKLLAVNRSPKQYLFSIANNYYKKECLQRTKKDNFVEEVKLQSLNKAIEDHSLLNERILRLKAIMETLPPKCKEILILNKYDGLKYQEIAELKNISAKTVEAQMRVAFTKIREGFAQFNADKQTQGKALKLKKATPEKTNTNKELIISKAVLITILFGLSGTIDGLEDTTTPKTKSPALLEEVLF